MTIGSLFSGIGGLELGLEWAGLGPTLWQVEKSPFCRAVLEKHWPNVERFEDVREVGSANLASVDLVCGGFPCQDVSGAGKGAGLAGERSGLWREFARVVGELRPRWVVVENVISGASRWLDAVVLDLEQLGYGCLPVPLSARDVGAPHRRARIFVVAHASPGAPGLPDTLGIGRQAGRFSAPSEFTALANPDGIGRQGSGEPQPGDQQGKSGGEPDGCGPLWSLNEGSDRCSVWETEPALGRVADGVPRRSHRLRSLGNAVVPQCAEVIGWVIRELAMAQAQESELRNL